MFKILNFFNRAPFNKTVFTNIQKAHIKRSMYKRVTVFSRLHFTTCFTISSWQKCHYYISTFLIKTILIVENLYRSCADLDIFFRGGGGRDNCFGRGRRGQSGAYFANYSQCKFHLFEISRGSLSFPHPSLDPRTKISTVMNVR